ncbi:hypothetical protein F5883DRAFT_513830 [Diaporthe sp. PMI_573]|nr:hypothetical protein F5883DRAFT_513830 [Diaporthaceae sp. PMI_573]
MKLKFLSLALLAKHASTQPPINRMPMLRFECSQLVIERLDPLVNPGMIPSPHVHQIVASTCTSCTFSEDFSNYWTAVLYFRARNGTYKRVPQYPSEGLTGDGGITVYYIASPDASVNVTAFRPGFRMLVGNAAADSPTSEPKTLPTGFCVGGIRSVITFPSCWDGKNLDSADHMSHISYPNPDPSHNGVGAEGVCPSTHPVKIPQVMYEVMWDTRPFNNKELWPEDGSQPFVWSTGDEHGYSQHGDYVFGWKDDSLQRAMDLRCDGDVCSGLERQDPAEAMKCTKARVTDEDIDGWLTEIPGLELQVAHS